MSSHRRPVLPALLLLCACAGARAPDVAAPPPAPTPAGPERWRTVWSDDFDGADGALPDPAKWSYDLGGRGWGSEELAYYLNGPKDAFLAGGLLHVVARRGGTVGILDCWYGECEYSSARLKTKGKYSFTYGRVSARIKVPKGLGLGPAFWMLGTDVDGVRWPACGELDVMGVVGREPRLSRGALHGPGYSGARGPTAAWSPATGDVGDDFHVFALEWDPRSLRFSVDGEVYATRTPADLPRGARWVFDHDFFLLLGLAVGGTWAGDPDASTVFPAEMLVDWVRVERRE